MEVWAALDSKCVGKKWNALSGLFKSLPTGQGTSFPSCRATFADCPPCCDNTAVLRDSRLRLRGYVADAQPCHCCAVPQHGGVEPGEQLPFFWKRHHLKMVRRPGLLQRCDIALSRWLNRQWWNLCITCLIQLLSCVCVVQRSLMLVYIFTEP